MTGQDDPPMLKRDICRTGRRGRQLAVLTALSFGVVLLVSALIATAGGWWTPWASRYMQGVDLSWHQGAIDWRALAADDMAFAYIKATEGADHIDERFAFNWREAGDAGLYRGAYHFFTLCQPGARQAANFIAVVPRTAGALPPALDLEHMGPCREGPTMTDVIAEARAFLDRAEAYYGVRPIIYTTREFHDAHLRELAGERFLDPLHRRAPQLPPARMGDLAAPQPRPQTRRRRAGGPQRVPRRRGSACGVRGRREGGDMSLIKWLPLSPDVEIALSHLEVAQSFDGLRGDYDLVQREAQQRSFPAFFAMLPGIILFAGFVAGAQALGWLALPEPFNYAIYLLVVPFAAITTNFIRGAQAVKDEQRLGRALEKWRSQADADTARPSTKRR